MSTELHTQIHAYGTHLIDDQAPITEAEVLALVESVRVLPAVEQLARAKARPWIAVAAAAVTLVVGGLIAWFAPRSDPDANPADTTVVSTTSPEVTIVSTTLPEDVVSTTSPDECRDCDAGETPVGLFPLDELDDAVLRPLDQIQLGDIIVPTAPTGWALDPEVYIDPDQPAFVVTVWNPDASRAYEIWAAPACEPTATRCPVFSYGSIPWPLTDPTTFTETINAIGTPQVSPAAVIGEYVVVVAPDTYTQHGILGFPAVRELIASLRAVAPDELPLQVTPTVRDSNPDPAAVEAALAPFQPLDDAHVMTPGSGGPLPRWRDGTVEESRHILALDNPHGHLDAWTVTGDRCVSVRISLAPGVNDRDVGPPVDDTWCFLDRLNALPERMRDELPFFFALSLDALFEPSLLGDLALILLKGGPDTIAFVVEEQDGRRVGLVAVSGLAFYLNGERNGCEEIPSELTAIEADGTTHTVSPWQLFGRSFGCS